MVVLANSEVVNNKLAIAFKLIRDRTDTIKALVNTSLAVDIRQVDPSAKQAIDMHSIHKLTIAVGYKCQAIRQP